MNFTNIRLKIRHFLRNYKTILLLAILIWGVVFFINLLIKNRPVDTTPQTTLSTHTSIIETNEKTPTKVANLIEDTIEEYIGYCNEGNYQKAFNMLSKDCQNYAFDNNVSNYMNHVLVKMPTPKKYSIQNYSTVKLNGTDFYIYEIRYFDDLLATGLTNSTYAFTSENLTFHKESGEYVMEAGNYIYHEDIKSISENEYLKLDVVDKVVNYSVERYEIKLTNRSNYTIVIADGQETEEFVLTLPNEVRSRSTINDIVLKPGETEQLIVEFPKFVDDGDESQAIMLSSIRVMETYSGSDEEIPDEVKKSEIDNAIAKFSMQVSVK